MINVLLGAFVLLLNANFVFADSFRGPESFESNSAPFKVLVFLSKDCPCSRSHVMHMNELSSHYEKVAFFGVITDVFDGRFRKDLQDYYADKNFDFPLIKDEEQILVKKYGALKTPHVVLLKRSSSGDYEKIYEGGVTDHRDFSRSSRKFLSENLEAVIHGKPALYSQGKSLGCYIRRI